MTLTQFAQFVAWLRRTHLRGGRLRSDSTINTILAAVGSFYEYQDRLGIETNISRSRRFGAKARTVAAEAKVSTAWLYSEPELRVRIMRSRKTTSYRAVPSASAAQDREHLSRQSIVATLRLRIKTLEERNCELTELLERAYGMIART